MKAFILEDDPERIVQLVRFFDKHSTSCAWAASCVQEDRFVGPYDLILLDHDLGGRQMKDHEDSGRAFLKLIKKEIGNALVIIHSYNGGAAALMKGDYPPAVLAPFGSVTFWSLLERVVK